MNAFACVLVCMCVCCSCVASGCSRLCVCVCVRAGVCGGTASQVLSSACVFEHFSIVCFVGLEAPRSVLLSRCRGILRCLSVSVSMCVNVNVNAHVNVVLVSSSVVIVCCLRAGPQRLNVLSLWARCSSGVMFTTARTLIGAPFD